MATFFRQMDVFEKRLKRNIMIEKYDERMQLFADLRAWLPKGGLVKKPQHKYILENLDMDNEFLSAYTGISVAGIKVFKSRLSKTLKELFGDDFCESICGSVKEYKYAQKIFDIVSEGVRAEDIIDATLVVRIRANMEEGLNMQYNITDCADEIRLLKKYSIQNIMSDYAECDIDKLCFLLRVLEGSGNVSISDRANLINKISPADLEGED